MDDDANTPVPYRPSNAWDGMDFQAQHCDRCQHEIAYQNGGDPCEILSAALAFSEADPEYPKEWIEDADGPRCTAFTPTTTQRSA